MYEPTPDFSTRVERCDQTRKIHVEKESYDLDPDLYDACRKRRDDRNAALHEAMQQPYIYLEPPAYSSYEKGALSAEIARQGRHIPKDVDGRDFWITLHPAPSEVEKWQAAYVLGGCGYQNPYPDNTIICYLEEHLMWDVLFLHSEKAVRELFEAVGEEMP